MRDPLKGLRVEDNRIGKESGKHHMSHSLNSLKGGYIKDYTEDYYRAY